MGAEGDGTREVEPTPVAFPGVGVETPGSAQDHTARSRVRVLVAGLFDAWDGGDGTAFTEYFTPAGRWNDGHTAISDHFRTVRRQEPWSLHFLTNETIAIDGDRASGTWLWFAASNVHGGATPAWSGGDLAIDAVRQPGGGWRIARLTMSDRFCTPRTSGWLTTPMLSRVLAPEVTDRGEPVGASGVFPAFATDDDGGSEESIMADQLVRNLMATFIGDASGAAARHFVDHGVFERCDLDGTVVTATGPKELAAQFEDDATSRPIMRVLTSPAVRAFGPRAQGRWRDIWVAHGRESEARWLAHRYDVIAEPREGRWQFVSMRRTVLLDCSYQQGWTLAGDRACP